MVHPITTEAEQTRDNTTSAGAANAASIDLGRIRKRVNVGVNVSADAQLTVEASHDGAFSGEEHTVETVTYNGSNTDYRSHTIAHRHVRAFLNSSVNELEVVSRGL